MSYLGSGAYGDVELRNGLAVKKFKKLSHLIQEYLALRYLEDCPHVVKARGVDFANLELHMELYDCSLRQWLQEEAERDGPSSRDIMTILHDILLGLTELHDRNLAHGDLKPGNILISRNPLRAVLGDCGFVSVAKYSKVARTAAPYRDPAVSCHSSHDMFSFGICCLEIFGGCKLKRQAAYEELQSVARTKIKDREQLKVVYNLVHPDRSRRPSARMLLTRWYQESPPTWIRPTYPVRSAMLTSEADKHRPLRHMMKVVSHTFNIHRANIGYRALVTFIDSKNLHSEEVQIYAAVTLMVLAAMFGSTSSKFQEAEALTLCQNQYSTTQLLAVLQELLTNKVYVKMLLSP